MEISVSSSLGGWISLAGLLVSVLGFSFAWSQLNRTATSSEESNRTLLRVGNRLHLNLLLGILPELSQISAKIDEAITKNDKNSVIGYFLKFSTTANSAAALLKENHKNLKIEHSKRIENKRWWSKSKVSDLVYLDTSETEIMELLELGAELTTKTKGALVRNPDPNILIDEPLTKTLEIIDTVTSRVSGLISIIQVRVS